MIPNLGYEELRRLLDRVFALREDERALLVLVDLPDPKLPDHPRWRDRRRIAAEWQATLRSHLRELPFTDVWLAVYPNVGGNNRDLPEQALRVESAEEDLLEAHGDLVSLGDLLARSSVVLAPTELSATAPLKLAAKRLGFRGATLPDFRREMIPVLALDWEAVSARVDQFKRRLDAATGIDVDFEAGGARHHCHFDLRFREAHASGALIREPGTVGNLPSGEAYIVPYEGERPGEASRTAGTLPVELDGELVIYRIERNSAVDVLSSGPRSDGERALLAREPAYGNMAEVGLGVLGEWGIQAIGSTLLDEKLGLHIAFGRSDHFGGITSPASFKDPEQVVHIDRVYVPSVQPQVTVRRAALLDEAGVEVEILRDGKYVV